MSKKMLEPFAIFTAPSAVLRAALDCLSPANVFGVNISAPNLTPLLTLL